MPADYLFPPVTGANGIVTLDGDTVLLPAMLGVIVALAGHELTLAELAASYSGSFYVSGPGSVAGELEAELAEGQTLQVVVHGGGYRWVKPPSNVVTLADGPSIAWNVAKGDYADVTLGGNRTLANPTNVVAGTYVLRVKQDGAGGRELAFGSNFNFSIYGMVPSITPDANAVDLLTFVSFGDDDLYLVPTPAFAPPP